MRILMLASVLLLSPAALRAEDPEAGEIPLSVRVGETASLGPGRIAPVRCDDPSLVESVTTASGLGLRGLRPGTTLCSALTAAATYVRYRVRVSAPEPASPARPAEAGAQRP